MNNKKKFLIVGSGGREAIFSVKLAQDSIVYSVMSHKNPTISHEVKKSGGEFEVANHSDSDIVLHCAKKWQIDYVFVSADEPLANGVVDVLLANNIKAIGGTKEATRIEWDKIYSIDLMKTVSSEHTPLYFACNSQQSLTDALNVFKQKKLEVVVKPQGLTGGKGVKVMPNHLKDYQQVENYANELLHKNPKEQVLLVEKLNGIEFTMMGLTDGKSVLLTPASYDYPYRLENDLGAGTGGMGCFTNSEHALPFMTQNDVDTCRVIMQKVISEIEKRNLNFNGVLNGGFFLTQNGIKFMEFNSRFGDPEALNVLSVLQSSFSELLITIWDKKLAEAQVSFIKEASISKYLVAHEYPDTSEKEMVFNVDITAIESLGLKVFFASCIQNEDGSFTTLKRSRVLAIVAVNKSIEIASQTVNDAIKRHVTSLLEYREDIGSDKSLKKLIL